MSPDQEPNRRPQEGKKNVSVMAKELNNNLVIKGFLALFKMVAPPAEKKEENRIASKYYS